MNAPQNLPLICRVHKGSQHNSRAEEQKPDGHQDNGGDFRESFSVQREGEPLGMKKERYSEVEGDPLLPLSPRSFTII